MRENSENNQSNEWKETLQHIKEYIVSLLKKKTDRKISQEKIKEDLEKALSSKSAEELEEKQEENLRDKIKKITGDEDDDKEHKPEEKRKPTEEQKPEKGGFELPPEDQDEYIPQDSEFGEALGEPSRFAEVYPPYLGYYAQGKKSFFNPKTNLRSKKKEVSLFSHISKEGQQIYTYAGYVQAGVTAIPLPDRALPNTASLRYHGSLPPIFQKDQHNCIYIISREKQAVSFQFTLDQVIDKKPPIEQDTQDIIFSSLSKKTQTLLDGVSGKNGVTQARALAYYIKTTKKYNTNKQGTLREISNSQNYINHLDESPILECYSANTLLVALCRRLGIPARLVVGHMVQSLAKDGKAHLSNNNGHARSEIRDGTTWQRLDATPTTKENEEASNQNMDDNQSSNQSAESNMDENADSNDTPPQEGGDQQGGQDQKKEGGEQQEGDQKEGEQSEGEGDDADSQENTDGENKPSESKPKQQDSFSGPRDQKPQPSKSSEQMLDEFIKKAKEDNLTAQGDELKKALDQLEQAENKEDIRKILDEAGISDFAKEELDKVGNQGILEEEKKELESIEDEKELEKKLQESLLDPEYKRKLKEYADNIKQKIQEQRDKMKSEMERMGFKEQELVLYKQYKLLEQEVMPEVRRQIDELKRLLPPQYLISRDEDHFYRSGARLDRNKLIDWKVNGNTKIFQRSKIEEDTQEINMFETIIIDRSGSMGNFSDRNSPFFQSIKAAITRAKVLEHFKVDMSIVIFDDNIDEVMSFEESFSERRTKIPSKLMRAATTRSGGNSQEPITHVYHKMKERMRILAGKSFGNISFIGDGDLYNFNQVPALKAMIEDLKRQGMGVTAYYINKDQKKMPLIEYYFGNPEDGNAIYAKDTTDLSAKLINNHKNKLNLLIKKYIKSH